MRTIFYAAFTATQSIFLVIEPYSGCQISKTKILGTPGSFRKGSYNLSGLRPAKQLVPGDAGIEIFDLHFIPPFSEDDKRNP
jgi:hypothetical protein